MQKKLFATLVFLGLNLSACSFVHKVDVEQGNVVTQDMVNQLHPGMTTDQVEFVMGHPVLVETFETHRSDYVYTFQAGGKTISEKQITLLFVDDHLTQISGTLHPELNADATALPPSTDLPVNTAITNTAAPPVVNPNVPGIQTSADGNADQH